MFDEPIDRSLPVGLKIPAVFDYAPNLPWRILHVGQRAAIVDGRGVTVVPWCSLETAGFIVTCVNAHPDLLEQIDELEDNVYNAFYYYPV